MKIRGPKKTEQANRTVLDPTCHTLMLIRSDLATLSESDVFSHGQGGSSWPSAVLLLDEAYVSQLQVMVLPAGQT